jgi:hypothetical protein
MLASQFHEDLVYLCSVWFIFDARYYVLSYEYRDFVDIFKRIKNDTVYTHALEKLSLHVGHEKYETTKIFTAKQLYLN